MDMQTTLMDQLHVFLNPITGLFLTIKNSMQVHIT